MPDDSLDETITAPLPPAVAGPTVKHPRRVGPYRILQTIGEGGMGIVYEAEQEAPLVRKVALKLIKVGMGTREVIARFESERQALALMNHPNIARVYDAGATPEGRPYFAMELVQGIAITEYCDKHRLTIPERLKLFVDVCEGVQHAHQKGIIHRDIKPSNVLVTTQGEARTPKIIDFGVAKAISQRLTENMVFTELGQVIGTREYMSPEQAEITNLDIDTRTDVYSLGVLLYELLAGKRPFDSKELRRAGLAEMERKLREEEPPKPSSRVSAAEPASAVSASNRGVNTRSLTRELAGDLDWITMKALEKDRVRRYETAHGLALDIQRHLRDEPVTAGPPRGPYRVRKLFRRHRGKFLATGAIALALIAGFITTSWALFRAVRAERLAAAEAVEARQQTAIAEAVNGFLNNDLLAAVAPSADPGKGKDVTMRQVLAVAGQRLEQASQAGGRFAKEPLVEAGIRLTIGWTLQELGEYAAAEPHLLRALELRRKALGDQHQETLRAMSKLGQLYGQQGRLDQAEPLYRNAYAIGRGLLGEDHRDVLSYEMNLATLLRYQGRYMEAEPLLEHNFQAKLRVLGAEHPDTLETMSLLANHYQETGRYDKAEALHRRTVDIRRRIQGERAPATLGAMNNLSNDLSLLGRYEESLPIMRRTLELKLEIYGPDHPTTLNSVQSLAAINDSLGRDAEAESLERRALEGRTRALGPRHDKTLQSKEGLATAISNQGRFAEAERLATTMVAECIASLGERHLTTLYAQDSRSQAIAGLGRLAEAEGILRRQLMILQEKKARGEDAGEGDDLGARMGVHLGMALAQLKRPAEAEPLLLESIPKLPARRAATTRAIRFLVRFYDDWNRSQPDPSRIARATEWRRRLEPSSGTTGAAPGSKY